MPHEEIIRSYYAILLRTLRICLHPLFPIDFASVLGV